MLNLTLKQLRYVEALARHRHFGRAADSCAISQPALSMQIKELEQSLGIMLFERGARQVRLTAFGEQFVRRGHDILRSVSELGELARAAKSGGVARLRIGVIPTIAPYLLPVLIGNLKQTYPALDLNIRETLTQKLIEDLNDGRIDTAIVALPISEPAFTEITLFSEDFVLVRPMADAAKPVPSAEDLRDMRLLLLEEGHCFRDQALSFCNIQSDRSPAGLDGSSLTTLVQMVAADLGVTLLPEMAVPVETKAVPVALARFDAPQPSRTVGMIWRRTNPLAQQLLQVSQIVRQSASQLQAKRQVQVG